MEQNKTKQIEKDKKSVLSYLWTKDDDDGNVNASLVVDYIDFTSSPATSVIECTA